MNEFKPFFPIWIVDAKQTGLDSLPDRPGHIIALEIKEACDAVSRKNIENLIKGNQPFLVLLAPNACEDNTDCQTETAELVELCLFSKNYFRIDNIPMIAFYRTSVRASQADNKLRPEWLIPHLHSQGWPEIKKWQLSPELNFQEQTKRKKASPLVLDHVDLSEACVRDHFLSNPSYLGSYIFFRKSPTHTPGQLEQAFSDLCTAAIGNNPLWEVSFREYMAAKDSLSELSRKNNMLQEMLNNAESTISLIKDTYQRDYHLLFKWYHKEYEVLPLWYKRFGHILKVLKGQRSFISLFNGSERKLSQ